MMMIPRRNDFSILEDMFTDPFFSQHESKVMKTDIREKGDKYIIDIDLPGYDKENIYVNDPYGVKNRAVPINDFSAIFTAMGGQMLTLEKS